MNEEKEMQSKLKKKENHLSFTVTVKGKKTSLKADFLSQIISHQTGTAKQYTYLVHKVCTVLPVTLGVHTPVLLGD